jgi:hypothetical protein
MPFPPFGLPVIRSGDLMIPEAAGQHASGRDLIGADEEGKTETRKAPLQEMKRCFALAALITGRSKRSASCKLMKSAASDGHGTPRLVDFAEPGDSVGLTAVDVRAAALTNLDVAAACGRHYLCPKGILENTLRSCFRHQL